MLIGAAVAVLGAITWGLGRLGFRGLPGDIAYEGQHTRVYFPIVTCLVLSLVATALLWLWSWLSRK
jgi:hypothetical protein